MAARILIVDDDPHVRATVRLVLEDAGYTVVEARDGCEGLDQLRSRGPFDLAVVDWRMPRLNGRSLCERIRGAPETRDMPIVVFSADIDVSLAGLPRTKLARKPMRLELLLGTIERALGVSMPRRPLVGRGRNAEPGDRSPAWSRSGRDHGAAVSAMASGKDSVRSIPD